jgi:diguanylate cyclase (GGDEF)-like protein/PAS domain S-box-containing protein
MIGGGVNSRSTNRGGAPAGAGKGEDALGAPDAALCESLLDLKSILLESVGDGVIAHTPEGDIVYANARSAEILGLSLEEMLASGPYGWTNPGNAAQSQERARKIRRPGGLMFESIRRRPDGVQVHIEVHARAVTVAPWGELFVSVSRDATARIAAQEELKRLAFHDGLTGLGNRLMLQSRIEDALAGRQDSEDVIGVVYMDLDDFKPVNDTHGHDVGDRVLCIVSERLEHSVRETDTIARVGGDEFIALFPKVTDGFDLSAKARALADAVSQPMAVDGVNLKVTMTLGLATHEHGESIEELVRRADHAMYRARAGGQAGWEEFQFGT